MTPSRKITKEMILDASYQIVEEKGIEHLNAREIARTLACSTQPIYSQFPAMDALKLELLHFLCAGLEQEISKEKEHKSKIYGVYRSIIELARNKPNIYKFIYFSDYSWNNNFREQRLNYGFNKQLLIELKEIYGISEQQAVDIFERMSLFIHGIATMLATTELSYDNDKIEDLIERTLLDMGKGAKTK